MHRDKMAEIGGLKKISFRGTEQKTAVQCGFCEGVERYGKGQSQHFGRVIFTHGNVDSIVRTPIQGTVGSLLSSNQAHNKSLLLKPEKEHGGTLSVVLRG